MLHQSESASVIAREASRYWWLFLIRGLLAIALGVVAAAFPAATLAALILLIGWYFLAGGVLAIVNAFRVLRTDPHWWSLLIEGVLSVIAALVILAWPGISLLSLAYLIGYWAIFTGVSALLALFRLRVHVPSGWIYTVFSVISLIFGIFVLIIPVTGLAYILIMLSIYGFVAGATIISLALRLRTA